MIGLRRLCIDFIVRRGVRIRFLRLGGVSLNLSLSYGDFSRRFVSKVTRGGGSTEGEVVTTGLVALNRSSY